MGLLDDWCDLGWLEWFGMVEMVWGGLSWECYLLGYCCIPYCCNGNGFRVRDCSGNPYGFFLKKP